MMATSVLVGSPGGIAVPGVAHLVQRVVELGMDAAVPVQLLPPLTAVMRSDAGRMVLSAQPAATRANVFVERLSVAGTAGEGATCDACLGLLKDIWCGRPHLRC